MTKQWNQLMSQMTRPEKMRKNDKLSLIHLCLVHVIWTGRRMSKLVLNVKYLLLLYFITATSFTIWDTFKDYKGALTRKRSYLGICTSFRSDFHVLKKSKQTFNIKFVIWRPVQMTWTRHKPIFCQSVSNLC